MACIFVRCFHHWRLKRSYLYTPLEVVLNLYQIVQIFCWIIPGNSYCRLVFIQNVWKMIGSKGLFGLLSLSALLDCKIILSSLITLSTWLVNGICLPQHSLWNYYCTTCSRKEHPLSTYTKFSDKLTFHTPWFEHVHVRTRGREMLVFQKISRM